VPHKVWQSLALGVPVITRRSRAPAEFFRDGEHLVEVSPGDPVALADAIERLCRDPDTRARIAAAGREAARVHGSPERIAPLLLEAIERARSAPAPWRRR
jgi:glycosyltransferase involved in cell wall biosynthesis